MTPARPRILRSEGLQSRAGTACLCALLLGACGEVGPQTTSSTHWLACEADVECENLGLEARCDGGYCVSPGGSRLARTLVMDEQFDASTLDGTAFDYETGTLLRNDEAQAYTDREQNVHLEDGQLVLTALAEPFNAASFTSGSVTTSGKRAFTFGRIEARIQVPLGRGCSSAFWLLPEDPAPAVNSCDAAGSCYLGTWPAWGDVTIANIQSRTPDRVLTSLNYGVWDDTVTGVRHGEVTSFVALRETTDGWHVFALEWGPERMDWIVDDEVLATTDLALPDLYLPQGEHPFHQPFHLKLNLALGGLDHAPVADDYPQELRVDWVRVTQWLPE
jgi:beta-glucanase (GH16 family)